MSQVRIVASLASLYAFRMLGLFMVLPILILYGGAYEGATPMLLGVALGIYGLTQACFQIPLGMWSDFVGRKPIIILGLVIFAIGSMVAALSNTIEGLIIGRALQGSGAIASAIMATVADLTSEENRTKAMAAIGASIGLSFSLAMILGPTIAGEWGIQSVFVISSALSVVGIFIVWFAIPKVKPAAANRDIAASPAQFRETVKHPQLVRLNFGIFSLHAILMISFIGIPGLIEQSIHLARENHWKFYLPIISLAFVLMLPFVIVAEKKRKIKPVFLTAIMVLGIANFALQQLGQSYLWVTLSVFAFFVAFNLLESILPSLVSKICPAGSKGTAMGIYSTSQFMGAFCGGTAGGLLVELFSASHIFGFSAILATLWFCAALSMAKPRHLASMSLPVSDIDDVDQIAKIPGVIEAFHSAEESALYLKVDRDILDEAALRGFTRASPG